MLKSGDSLLYLILLLCAIDVVLIFLFFKKDQKVTAVPPGLLSDLTEERRQLTAAASQIRGGIDERLKVLDEKLLRLSTMGADLEQDLSKGKEEIASHLSLLAKEFPRHLDEPLKELVSRRGELEVLLRRAGQKQESFSRMIDRVEELATLMARDLSYEDFVKALHERKLSDGRALLVRGLPPDQVAQQVGLSLGEVEAIVRASASLS